MTTKPVKFKIPKSLGACADMLYEIKNKRLELQNQAAEFEEQEQQLKNHLINNLPKSQASGISGKHANAVIKNKVVAEVFDYDALHAYILKKAKKEPGIWGLLQKSVSSSTVKEMWEAKVEVPGVKPRQIPYVSLTKLS